MKKHIRKILYGIILLLVVPLFVIYIVPFFHPLSFEGRSVPYEYVIYGTHAEIVSYTGQEKEVVIPKTLLGHKVTVLGAECFSGNTSMRKLIIPETMESISCINFYECPNLEEVIMPYRLDVLVWFYKLGSCHDIKKYGIKDIDKYASLKLGDARMIENINRWNEQGMSSWLGVEDNSAIHEALDSDDFLVHIYDQKGDRLEHFEDLDEKRKELVMFLVYGNTAKGKTWGDYKYQGIYYESVLDIDPSDFAYMIWSIEMGFVKADSIQLDYGLDQIWQQSMWKDNV